MPEVSSSKYLVMAGWDDVPHLTEKAKRELLASTPPYLREARSKGIPALGSGAIYPIGDEDIVVPAFAIPDHWRRLYGLDVGWNNTAAIWLTEDPETNVRYAYGEYKRGEAVPLIHASAIKLRGEWVPGVIDPAARGRQQNDGEQLFQTYVDLGLNLSLADNSVESGIYGVWSGFETGRLKVFSTLVKLLTERRLYRRDDRGRIVKEDDHLLDALRYANVLFHALARAKPAIKARQTPTGPADSLAGY